MKLYFDFDNIIDKNVIGSTLYKKEKDDALAKSITVFLFSVLGIIIWIDVLLKETSLAMNFLYLKCILFFCIVIMFIFYFGSCLYFYSKDKDYTFFKVL